MLQGGTQVNVNSHVQQSCAGLCQYHCKNLILVFILVKKKKKKSGQLKSHLQSA